MSGDDLRQRLVIGCKILSREGLVRGFGHLSARLPGEGAFLISPRVSLALVEEPDLAIVTLDGQQVAGPRPMPMETPLHTAIYRRRPDVMSITRLHPKMVLVLSVLGRTVAPVHSFGTVLPRPLPLFPSSALIRTPQRAEALADALGHAPGVILRGNGAVVVGGSIAETCVRAVYLEESAEILYRALSIGAPCYLTPEEAEEGGAEILPPVDLERAWNYYADQVLRDRAGAGGRHGGAGP